MGRNFSRARPVGRNSSCASSDDSEPSNRSSLRLVSDEIATSSDLSEVFQRADNRGEVERCIGRTAKQPFAANSGTKRHKGNHGAEPGNRSRQLPRHSACGVLLDLPAYTHV
jgi:hypothetical protein